MQPTDIECIRVFFLIPLCHLFRRIPEHLESITNPYQRALLRLKPTAARIVSSWFGLYNEHMFGDFVRSLKGIIDHVLIYNKSVGLGPFASHPGDIIPNSVLLASKTFPDVKYWRRINGRISNLKKGIENQTSLHCCLSPPGHDISGVRTEDIENFKRSQPREAHRPLRRVLYRDSASAYNYRKGLSGVVDVDSGSSHAQNLLL